MYRMIAIMCGLFGLYASQAFAATLSVPLTTNANQDTGLARLYVDECNDRLERGQTVLAGCTSSGSPATCSCAPNQNQLENALSFVLQNALSSKFAQLKEREAAEIRRGYTVSTPAQQDAIKAACPACQF